jgi:hypothetical protein
MPALAAMMSADSRTAVPSPWAPRTFGCEPAVIVLSAAGPALPGLSLMALTQA